MNVNLPLCLSIIYVIEVVAEIGDLLLNETISQLQHMLSFKNYLILARS